MLEASGGASVIRDVGHGTTRGEGQAQKSPCSNRHSGCRRAGGHARSRPANCVPTVVGIQALAPRSNASTHQRHTDEHLVSSRAERWRTGPPDARARWQSPKGPWHRHAARVEAGEGCGFLRSCRARRSSHPGGDSLRANTNAGACLLLDLGVVAPPCQVLVRVQDRPKGSEGSVVEAFVGWFLTPDAGWEPECHHCPTPVKPGRVRAAETEERQRRPQALQTTSVRSL